MSDLNKLTIEEVCRPQKLDQYWFLPPSTILGKGINPNLFVVEVVFMYLTNVHLQMLKNSTCLFSRDAKPCTDSQQAAEDEEGYQHDLTLEDLCSCHLHLSLHMGQSLQDGENGQNVAFFNLFWSSAVTKRFDFFNFSQLFCRDFAR